MMRAMGKSVLKTAGSLDRWGPGRQIPSSKLQIPTHSQLPSSNVSGQSWQLGVGSALEFGIWSLGFDAQVSFSASFCSSSSTYVGLSDEEEPCAAVPPSFASWLAHHRRSMTLTGISYSLSLIG